MAIGWYLAVSAIVFCIGAGGVLVRRNPLVILLCLELMLNGANLMLVAFARMWGGEDGQIFALIVMVIAACEVTVFAFDNAGTAVVFATNRVQCCLHDIFAGLTHGVLIPAILGQIGKVRLELEYSAVGF